MLFGSVCCGICEETEVKAAFEEEELQLPQLVFLSRLAGVASNPMVRTVLITPKAAAPSGGRPTKRRRRSSGGRPTTRRRSTGGRPKTRRRRSTGGRPTTRRRHAGKIKSGWSGAVADVAMDKIGSFPGGVDPLPALQQLQHQHQNICRNYADLLSLTFARDHLSQTMAHMTSS